jgi:hypothetical protein
MYTVLVRKPEGNTSEDIGLHVRTILKWILKNRM